MESRRPRVNVSLTQPRYAWLRWWAAEQGQTLAEAAGRLLDYEIERRRADPALERAYQDDLRRGPIERELLGDVARAFDVEGVAAALAGSTADLSEEALCAARYLVDVSSWLTDPRLPDEKGGPPRLAESPPTPLVARDIAGALDLIGRTPRHVHATAPPRGYSGVSDKRQLSDNKFTDWLQRAAGRAGEDIDGEA